MRHTIETGSDVAAWCAFDPGAVVSDLPTAAAAIEWAKLEALQVKNKLWLHSTGSDGTYLVQVLVDESLPEHFAPHAKPIGKPTKLQVPTGTLCVSGAEDLANAPIRPNQSETVSIPAGTYDVSAWALEWPEDKVAAKLTEGVDEETLRRRNRIGLLGVGYFIATGICILLAIFVTAAWAVEDIFTDRTALAWWGGFALMVTVVPRFLPTASPGEVERENAIRSEFPDFVLRLKPA
jgi:hypothetical protein